MLSIVVGQAYSIPFYAFALTNLKIELQFLRNGSKLMSYTDVLPLDQFIWFPGSNRVNGDIKMQSVESRG